MPVAAAPDGPADCVVFSRGGPGGRVTLRVEDGVLTVTISGDPAGAEMVACFRAAFAADAIAYGTVTLVDLMDFNGKVDWASIRAIGELSPWRGDAARSSRVAYLTESVWFGALLKLVTVMFPKTAHRQFDDRAAALQWLKAQDQLRGLSLSGS
jgi:hypothetical protein